MRKTKGQLRKASGLFFLCRKFTTFSLDKENCRMADDFIYLKTVSWLGADMAEKYICCRVGKNIWDDSSWKKDNIENNEPPSWVMR